MTKGIRIVEGALPSEKIIFADSSAEPLFEGSLWWFEHMAGQMERHAELLSEREEDSEKAQNEAKALYLHIVSGGLAQELGEWQEVNSEAQTPSAEELLQVYQQRVAAERFALNAVELALSARDPSQLLALQSDSTFTKLSEKIHDFGKGEDLPEQKATLDTTTLWASLLARSMMVLDRPSVAVRKGQRTAKKGHLLGNHLLDVAVRKSARYLSSALSIPSEELERDLVCIVRDSPAFYQSFAAVVRLLRDMTDEPWVTCPACESRNEAPWSECGTCGAAHEFVGM